MVGFCFSLNEDVSWLLRRCGLSASMFLTHDLRIITKNQRVELNPIQKQLLKDIGNPSLIFKISLEIKFSVENPELNVFLWGFSGSGKTAISMETVKIKVSHCKEKNKPVRVIVTKYWVYEERDDLQLLTNMREYLKNIEVEILSLYQLCEDLNCKWDITQPKDTINAVIRSLSSDKTDQLTIFVCDEVSPCQSEGQTTPDWTDLATADNVEWILSMRPSGKSKEAINMKPPSDPSILDRKLLHGHRNSYPIRSVSSS